MIPTSIAVFVILVNLNRFKIIKSNKCLANNRGRNQTIVTTSLMRHSSISFKALSCGIQIDSENVSIHRQFPFRAGALLDLAMVLPVSTKTTDTTSLSHPFGTCNSHITEHIIAKRPSPNER